MRYTEEWNKLTKQMGYWVDTGSPYITYKNKYIETVWFLLKRLFDKKLIYKGYTIQPYSPAAGTGLSSHELNQPGCYRDVKDTSVVAQFDRFAVDVLAGNLRSRFSNLGRISLGSQHKSGVDCARSRRRCERNSDEVRLLFWGRTGREVAA